MEARGEEGGGGGDGDGEREKEACQEAVLDSFSLCSHAPLEDEMCVCACV
jgi:hypothetical protein